MLEVELQTVKMQWHKKCCWINTEVWHATKTHWRAWRHITKLLAFQGPSLADLQGVWLLSASCRGKDSVSNLISLFCIGCYTCAKNDDVTASWHPFDDFFDVIFTTKHEVPWPSPAHSGCFYVGATTFGGLAMSGKMVRRVSICLDDAEVFIYVPEANDSEAGEALLNR